MWLHSKTIQGGPLPFEGVDDVTGRHRLATCMCSVQYCVPEDVFQIRLQHRARLFVDQSRDLLDATTACQAADRRLGDALNIAARCFAALGATLSKTSIALASIASIDSRSRFHGDDTRLYRARVDTARFVSSRIFYESLVFIFQTPSMYLQPQTIHSKVETYSR
jgi:hypothetical protein